MTWRAPGGRLCAGERLTSRIAQISWAEHKAVHKVSADAWLFCTKRGKGRSTKMPDFHYTGDLRPHLVGPTRSVGPLPAAGGLRADQAPDGGSAGASRGDQARVGGHGRAARRDGVQAAADRSGATGRRAAHALARRWRVCAR